MASPEERQARKEQRSERKAARAGRRQQRKQQRAAEDDGRARLLAKLLLCPDEELSAFGDKRLPADSQATPVHLHQARRILEGVIAILSSGASEPLDRLEAAEAVLLELGSPEAAPQLEATPEGEPHTLERPAFGASPSAEAPALVARGPISGAPSPWSRGEPPPRLGPPTPPFNPPPPAAVAPAGPAPAARPRALTATAMASEPTVLPFQGSNQPPPLAIDGDDEDVGGTVVPGAMNAVGHLPFKPAAAPELTLEQYASLCAEREHRPEEVEAIARVWGLDSEEAQALDRTWQVRLQADPAAAERFQGLVASYRSWLARQS